MTTRQTIGIANTSKYQNKLTHSKKNLSHFRTHFPKNLSHPEKKSLAFSDTFSQKSLASRSKSPVPSKSAQSDTNETSETSETSETNETNSKQRGQGDRKGSPLLYNESACEARV